jgi:hypothetical protein
MIRFTLDIDYDPTEKPLEKAVAVSSMRIAGIICTVDDVMQKSDVPPHAAIAGMLDAGIITGQELFALATIYVAQQSEHLRRVVAQFNAGVVH